jgi:recombination protein RecT
MECLKAATLKLPINKALGFAYVIKFNNSVQLPDGTWTKVPTPTFIPGYKGYIQMAMRTGQYRTINADIVYEGEIQKVNKLTGELRFDGTKTSDKVVGYFAYFELLNGFNKTLYVELEDMAKHAKKYSPSIKADKKVTIETLKSLAGKDPSGIGWSGGFDDMAIKTVLRNLLSKYGYLSVEMQNALSDDIRNDYEEKNPAPIQVIDIDAQILNDSQNQSTEKKNDLPPYLQQ